MNVISIDGNPGRNSDDQVLCVCRKLADWIEYDYTTFPMIWCEKCGRRSVTCPRCPPRPVKELDVIDKIMGNIVVPADWENAHVHRIMKIFAISTRQIYARSWPVGTTEADILQSISTDLDGDGILYLDDIDGEIEPAPGLWLSVSCYNVEESCVKGLDTSHDGVYVWLKCQCENCGRCLTTSYWGC